MKTRGESSKVLVKQTNLHTKDKAFLSFESAILFLCVTDFPWLRMDLTGFPDIQKLANNPQPTKQL